MANNPIDYGWEKAIWNALLPIYDGNEFAVAGTMGNWYTESYLVPFQRENDARAGEKSKAYAAKIDNGTYSRAVFIANSDGERNSAGNLLGPGFGLAQWTDKTRKARMYDMWNTDAWRGAGVSFGSLNYGIAWFKEEITKYYPNTYAGMKRQTSASAASDYFLRNFEGIWNESYVNRRAQADYYYKKYTGSEPGPEPPDPGPDPPPDPPTPPTPTPTKPRKMKLIYYLRRKY